MSVSLWCWVLFLPMKGGTPLIVQTDVKDFSTYIQSLSTHARKDWAYVKKHNQDLTYAEVPYKRQDVERFMEIWSKQTIHGNEPVNWAFDISHVDKLHEAGVLRVFQAKRGEDIIAMHFIERHGIYLECHPPMYDKKHGRRYLAKFMWFNLIGWAIDSGVRFLDLGSGDRGTWRELVTNRKLYPRIAYKWLYIPDAVKKHPEREKDYLVYEHNGTKWISENHQEPTQDLHRA